MAVLRFSKSTPLSRPGMIDEGQAEVQLGGYPAISCSSCSLQQRKAAVSATVGIRPGGALRTTFVRAVLCCISLAFRLEPPPPSPSSSPPLAEVGQ